MTYSDKHVIRSHLPLDVFARTDGHPTGDYKLLGNTPGEIIVPSGYVPILRPLDLDQHLGAYASLWASQNLDSVYFRDCRNYALIKRFLEIVRDIRHVVLKHCGWSLSFLESCPNVEWVELHEEVSMADIQCISKLPNLRGLVVTGCNNIFSGGIPCHNKLEMLILRNIANLQNSRLIEDLGEYFPELEILHLNGVNYSGESLNLSFLQSLRKPLRLQAVGTRVTDESGRFAEYCAERQHIDNYIESLSSDSTNACLSWSSVHQDDISLLAENNSKLRSLKLCGCRDLVDLNDLLNLDGLTSLTAIDCINVSSLAPLAMCSGLRQLVVDRCNAISDYQCLSSCRKLSELYIAGGSGRAISDREYAKQMADLHIELPRSCTFRCDVPENVMIAIIEEVPQYIEALKQELAYLNADEQQGGINEF